MSARKSHLCMTGNSWTFQQHLVHFHPDLKGDDWEPSGWHWKVLKISTFPETVTSAPVSILKWTGVFSTSSVTSKLLPIVLATSPRYETFSSPKAATLTMSTSFRRDFSETRPVNNIERNALHQSSGNIWLWERNTLLSLHEIDQTACILWRSFHLFEGLAQQLHFCQERLRRCSKLSASASKLHFDKSGPQPFLTLIQDASAISQRDFCHWCRPQFDLWGVHHAVPRSASDAPYYIDSWWYTLLSFLLRADFDCWIEPVQRLYCIEPWSALRNEQRLLRKPFVRRILSSTYSRRPQFSSQYILLY